jgi:hypothetical protein
MAATISQEEVIARREEVEAFQAALPSLRGEMQRLMSACRPIQDAVGNLHAGGVAALAPEQLSAALACAELAETSLPSDEEVQLLLNQLDPSVGGMASTALWERNKSMISELIGIQLTIATGASGIRAAIGVTAAVVADETAAAGGIDDPTTRTAISAAAGSVSSWGYARLLSTVLGETRRAAAVPLLELAQPGEDLFVGTYSRSYRANASLARRLGLPNDFTPHHVVQNAVSPVSHGRGITINLRRDLHELTRTFRNPNVDRNLSLRTHLARDVADVRRILLRASYDPRFVRRQLRELIRQNKAVWQQLNP